MHPVTTLHCAVSRDLDVVFWGVSHFLVCMVTLSLLWLLQRRAAMDVGALLGSRGLFDAGQEDEDEDEEQDYYFTDDSDLEP
eukprot:3090711-Pyramimonas_sp.AAC.1